MANCIPTVDISPFFTEENQDGRKKAMELITEACSQYGFFQIENHGIPLNLLSKSIQLSKTFFGFSDDEKLKSSPKSDGQLLNLIGYNRQPEKEADKNEYVLLFSPGSGFNVYPQNPPGFKEVLEEVFTQFAKIGLLMESILNDCLGLPPNSLKEYHIDRSWDVMAALHYFPLTGGENYYGIAEHEDANFLSFVFQDDVGGLEVNNKNGEWIPVTPSLEKIVVNVGDVIQVLSNNKFKSATHRVVSPKEKDRYSYAFFLSLSGDKWVEPLPQFTEAIGEPPKYRGFLYKEYQGLRLEYKTKPEDVIHITRYAVSS